jgi:mono/diheme cytochrome c family protein
MSTMTSRSDAETQKKSKYLCVSESLWLVTVIIVAMVVTIAAQVRPTPQPPPRRTAPAPRTPPPPKREGSEPTEPKPAQDRGPQGSTPQVKAADATPSDAGAALYKKNGCYECHVNDAQGGPQGPRLGPNPIPLPRFVAYVRNPAGDMPPYTAKVISDQDLASIYAFLQARPTPPPVKDIPLLAP